MNDLMTIMRLEFPDSLFDMITESYLYHKDKGYVPLMDLRSVKELIDSKSHTLILGMCLDASEGAWNEECNGRTLKMIDQMIKLSNSTDPRSGIDLMLIAEIIRILGISTNDVSADFMRGGATDSSMITYSVNMLILCISKALQSIVELSITNAGEILARLVKDERSLIAKTLRSYRDITQTEQYVRLWRKGISSSEENAIKSLNDISDEAKKYFPPCINTYALMGQSKLQARLQHLVFNSIRWLIYLEEDYYKNNPEKVLVSMVGNDAIDAIANEVEMLSVKMTLLTIGALKDRKGDGDENIYSWNVDENAGRELDAGVIFGEEIVKDDPNYATVIGMRYATMYTLKIRYPFLMLEDKFPFIKEDNVKPLIDELFVEAQE